MWGHPESQSVFNSPQVPPANSFPKIPKQAILLLEIELFSILSIFGHIELFSCNVVICGSSHLRPLSSKWPYLAIWSMSCTLCTLLFYRFILGQNLSELVFVCKKRGAKFPRAHLVHILAQQNSAIQFLRENEVMHCDIKPENIIYNM